MENGLRQGDALSCLLFNIILECIFRDSGINTKGIIFDKSIQVLAYADDVDIIARTERDLRDAFVAFEKSAMKFNLKINVEKTKFMVCTKDRTIQPCFEVDTYRFETVQNFCYLGSIINSDNNIDVEVKKRIISTNRCLNGLRSFLRSTYLKRDTKLLLYKTIIRPVLTYASETWTLSKKEEASIAICERKILRTIFGGIKEGNLYRRRTNDEIYKNYRDIDVIKFIKLNRIRFAGHICRLDATSPMYRIFKHKPIGNRTRGRPKLRWLDSINSDFKTIRVQNWQDLATGRTAWRNVLKKAKAHPGLSCQR